MSRLKQLYRSRGFSWLRWLYRSIYYIRGSYIIDIVRYRHVAFVLNRIRTPKEKVGCIVSFTTMPERFDRIDMMVGSLLLQSIKPIKIILWIGFDPTQSKKMRDKATKLRNAGIIIKQIKDIGPYTKLVYALSEFRSIPIITMDDDRIYAHRCIEGLFETHQKFPRNIVCNSSLPITFNENGIERYSDWRKAPSNITGPSLSLLPLGTGGVLYPPGCLDDRVTDVSKFMKLAPHEDDIWFKAMSLLKGTKVVQSDPSFYAGSKDVRYRTDKKALWESNKNDGNYIQIKQVFECYSQLIDILKREASPKVQPSKP